MRIIIAGGRGFFGRTIVELMRDDGLAPLVVSMRHSLPRQACARRRQRDPVVRIAAVGGR